MQTPNYSTIRNKGEILSPYSLQTLSQLLFQTQQLVIQINPESYCLPAAEKITQQHIYDELLAANTNREHLYEVLGDWFSTDTNPISQIILDLTF
jgi:hypothetical protein